MFNGMLKSDDVEVYGCDLNVDTNIALGEDCKSQILIGGATNQFVNIQLPMSSYIGKTISITAMPYTNGTGKSSATLPTIRIQHSATTLFTLKQGTVSFMYVGQQLNGLTSTASSKSGWIILGGVQGDTAITGYAGSVAIGSGAYCSGLKGVAIGSGAYSMQDGVAIGRDSIGHTGIALGLLASSNNRTAIALGISAYSGIDDAVSIGNYAQTAYCKKISFKANPQFSIGGDAQAGKFILMRQTIDATPLPISATNGGATTTNILILPNNGTYAFKGTVVAKDATTLDSAMWEVTALMRRGANASTTALVGTPTITKVFNDAGAAAWTIALTADTTLGGGVITVTGEAGKTIRWVSNIDSAEVI